MKDEFWFREPLRTPFDPLFREPLRTPFDPPVSLSKAGEDFLSGAAIMSLKRQVDDLKAEIQIKNNLIDELNKKLEMKDDENKELSITERLDVVEKGWISMIIKLLRKKNETN